MPTFYDLNPFVNQRRSDIGVPKLVNYSQKKVGMGFRGFYKVPQSNPFGINSYDEARAMDAMTSRLSHRKSEPGVNIKSMKGRDEAIYEQNDFKVNIELENTKE